jgi:hypothetical protein
VELSPEDQLRLNVLLAHDVQAIRIDESALSVLALTGAGEACVALNPNCRAEQYLKRVRELLSYRALGSPGGYPVFLQRWTRMGQHRDGQLDKLLLLGEPEAVVAVAGAPSLTPELARRVWWAQPNSDIARRVLENESVAASEFGRVASAYLLEHLAFETEPLTVVHTIRLVLQPGLISVEARTRLWERAVNRTHFHRLGFIEADANALPDTATPRALPGHVHDALKTLVGTGNALAALLGVVFGRGGQTFLSVAGDLLRRPVDKYTVALLLNAIGRYFAPARGDTADAETLATLSVNAYGDDARELLESAPDLHAEVLAAIALARVDESLATPVLARTTATGTLLGRKLDAVIEPILKNLATLQGNVASR